jgi:hypothetical protein
MALSHIHTTMNHIEEVEDESKEDNPIYHIEEVEDESKEDNPNDIYMENISAVDKSITNITFKDTKNAKHIRCRFHLVKQGVPGAWHTFVWINNQSMVADVMTKLLPKKDILHKI